MKELTLLATTENIDRVIDFVNEELENNSCPLKTKLTLDVAIDEIFANIANYAYAPNTGEVTIKVEFTENPKGCAITFIDGGTPYDPLKKDDPNVKLSAVEREIGGLGVFIVKKSMDNVEYEYKNNKNILKITKLYS